MTECAYAMLARIFGLCPACYRVDCPTLLPPLPPKSDWESRVRP